MRYEIRYKPSFAAAFIILNSGERIAAEAGAMASMDGRLTLTTEFFGGLISELMRRVFGGESLFVNVFHNQSGSLAELVLTQGASGDIEVLQLKPGEELCFHLTSGRAGLF